MRLRTQLTLTVTALVALVVALAGLVIVVRIDHRDRADLDNVLATRLEQVRAAATKNGSLPTDGSYAIRLIQGGEMLKQVGSSAGFPLPAKDGYSTVSSGDDEWRSVAETLPTGAQIQILVSLDDLKGQHTDNVLVVDLLVLLAAVLSAAGVWFATGLVLRPFQRLLVAARDLDPADPEQRLPEVKSPREVTELTATLNDLLDRARAAAPSATPASSSGLSPAAAGSPAATDASSGDPAAVAEPTVEMRAVERRRTAKPKTAPSSEIAPDSGPAASAPESQAQSTSDASSPAPGSGATSVASPAPGSEAVSAASSPDTASGSGSGFGDASAASSPEIAPTSSSSPAPAGSSPELQLAPTSPGSAPAGSSPEPVPAAAASFAPAAPAPSPAVAELRPSLADLGFQLDQLLDNPEMPATQRHLILALMADEHRRMTALIDGDA
ncbi:HAMP domain-containing protein [Actinoplanes sp. LDG1-06]|uniref:histidine kinase n=1 Tax=Paractinoplanes ovalisporus TaxID=2810368 RepID=A0ABS2AG58_9ACTN|nr:HAMP domain-containing protein [Actinoplanes ovalisporus]MBM2618244.1 HAMP domain-containing protein [Actinoplanes ovalisporus]